MTAGATPPQTQARCDNCAATMTWDAASGKLRCDSCGASRDPVDDGGGRIAEYDLDAGLAMKPRGRIGAGAREVKCGECGAIVELPDGMVAGRCSFCDSPQVTTSSGGARADHVRPESLVPFSVARDASLSAFKGWIRGRWFRPSDLAAKASVSELRGVYIPYWTFDTDVSSRWTADAGYHYYTTERFKDAAGNWQTRRVQHVRWEPAHGARDDQYDDHLVCASRGLPGGLARSAGDFDTGALVAYSSDYLMGFAAESYAVELREAWTRAKDELEAAQERRCRGDVPGDTQRHLSCNHRFRSTRFKHVLLPLWIAAFRYRDKVYRFLVNGQTGRVSGEAPLSWPKILAFAAVLVAAIVALVVFLRR